MTNLWWNCHQRLPFNSSLHVHSHCYSYTLPQVQTVHSSLTAMDFGYCQSLHEPPTKSTKHPTARTTFLKDLCHCITTLVKCLQWLCTDHGMKFRLLMMTFWLLRMSTLPVTLASQFPPLFPDRSMPILISTVLLFIPRSPSLPGKQIQPPTHIFPYLVYAFDLSCVSNNQNLSQGPEY